jgi:hypothetical protein
MSDKTSTRTKLAPQQRCETELWEFYRKLSSTYGHAVAYRAIAELASRLY